VQIFVSQLSISEKTPVFSGCLSWASLNIRIENKFAHCIIGNDSIDYIEDMIRGHGNLINTTLRTPILSQDTANPF
jgi:hypothetical protein